MCILHYVSYARLVFQLRLINIKEMLRNDYILLYGLCSIFILLLKYQISAFKIQHIRNEQIFHSYVRIKLLSKGKQLIPGSEIAKESTADFRPQNLLKLLESFGINRISES
jgi:hypothetical protein